MREAIDGERALGSHDRGLLGGFSAALLRKVRADNGALGKTRAWAMAALTSYRLKDRAEREEVGLRLSPHLLEETRPDAGGASLDCSDRVNVVLGPSAGVASMIVRPP